MHVHERLDECTCMVARLVCTRTHVCVCVCVAERAWVPAAFSEAVCSVAASGASGSQSASASCWSGCCAPSAAVALMRRMRRHLLGLAAAAMA